MRCSSRHSCIVAVRFVSLALLASACDSDSSPTGTGGSAGSNASSAGNAGSSGSSGASGIAGGPTGEAGLGGQTGNAAGSGPGPIVPDESKNCQAAQNPSVPSLQLTEIAGGLQSPVYLTQPRGETERLFVVEQQGTIVILRGQEITGTPFLDINELVSGRDGEMGLLGLAFHPSYLENGRFYVYYSTEVDGPHRSRVVEYTVSDSDPDQADPASARILLELDQPEVNHNGGDLEFGLDGLLYIGTGDGGGGGDQHGDFGNGQNLSVLLGKMLRIDVDGTGQGESGQYAIPSGNMASNPLTANARPELWSYGLRNPWRFSFDACTGDMYIADVGQDQIEEVNFEPANTGGRNYGWRLMEADACFNPDNGCNAQAQNLVLPVANYDHGTGQSITGGYVYRGSAIPDLRGTYLYADFSSARFFALRMSNGSVAAEQQDISDNIDPNGDISDISSFGQDRAGELYVMSTLGSLFRIDAE